MAGSCGSAKVGTTIGIRRVIVVLLVIASVAGGQVAFGLPQEAEKSAASGTQTPAKTVSEVSQPQEENAPTDDDEFEMGDDLVSLVVPSSMRVKATVINKLEFSQNLRRLLIEDTTAARDALAAARRHFEAAHRARADDARAPYALGIVLLAHENFKEALEHFSAASQESPVPFLPALQATAWVHILRHDPTKGLPALLDLAHKIEEPKGPWPTEQDRQHSADWLGRMVGYLTGPGKQSEQANEVERLAGAIEKLLTHERRDAYEHGVKWIARRHDKMKSLATRPVEEVLAEARQQRAECRAAAQAAEADVKRLEDEIREIKRPHDKQLASLNHELRTAATKHKKAADELAEAVEEVEFFSIPLSHQQVKTTGGGRYRRPVVTSRAETAQEKKTRETRLASAKKRQQEAQSTLDQTKQSLTDLKSQREQAATDFRQATAEKRLLLDSARKKSHELAAHAKDIEHVVLTPEKIRSRATALETYVPLDPEAEKTRLLATLKSAG